MRRWFVWFCLLSLVALGCAGGGGGDVASGGGQPPVDPNAADGPPFALVAGSRSSGPLGFSADNRVMAAVNPESDTVSFFGVSGPPQPDAVTRILEFGVGDDPQAVALAGNTRAYVANAVDGTVSVVATNQLLTQGTATLLTTITVGTEPSALVLSPNGTRLYVANAGSNDVSVIDTASNAVVATVDLSAIGGSEPRALAVTNDGDASDLDEKLYVAEFFAALRPGMTGLQEGQDDQREGRVAVLNTGTNALAAAPVTLGPMASTGFNANGRLAPAAALVPSVPSTNPQTFTTPTGAFPNQLASIGIHPTSGRAYLVSTAASPNGPLRFNHMAQGLVSVFDTATDTEVTAGQTDPTNRREAPLNLNRGINLATTPAPRLFLTNPVGIVWRPNGAEAWVTVQNTNVLVRLNVDAGGIPSIGAPLVAGPSNVARVDLQDVGAGLLAGKAPQGAIFNAAGNRLYVFNFVSRSVSVVDPDAAAVIATAVSSAQPTTAQEIQAQLGAELFFTGRGPQERMSSESWGACIACHPRGLADGVTWMFDAGPRQTIPLDGMFSPTDDTDQRILNWSAVRDENQDFELNTRGVFGGRGLIDDDRLFLAVGGAAGATPTDTTLIEQFQQFTGVVGTTNDLTGGTLPELLAARRDFGLATLPDDRLLIVGGRSGGGDGAVVTAAAVMEFNPRTNALITRSSTGFTPRHSLGAAAVRTSQGVRVYAIGGYTSTNQAAPPVTTVEEYNPDTNTWRTVAALPQAVAEFAVTVAGGVNTADPRQVIHVTAGNIGPEGAPVLNGGATIVQRFLAEAAAPGVWSNFAVAGLTPRRNAGAATALRGVAARIFLIGGRDAAGTALGLVEEYTNATVPATVLTPHTALPAPRFRFGIGSSLSTNQIYVVGGVDGALADQATVFEYTIGNNGPVAGPPGTPSGSWVTRANLSAPRRGLALSTPPGVGNFHPVANTGRDAEQDAINTWIQLRVRPSVAPVAATDASAQSGRTLFGTTGLVVPGFSCATCHGGAKWTRSLRDFTPPPSPADNLGLGNENVIGAELRKTATQPALFPGVLINVGTFDPTRPNEIRFNGADIGQAIAPLGANGFNIPSLLSVNSTAPYFHSGAATTLDGVLDGSQDANGGTRHHFVLSAADRANLVRFLRSIDVNTPVFP